MAVLSKIQEKMAATTTLNLTRVDVREILMQNDIVRLHTRCGSNICNRS